MTPADLDILYLAGYAYGYTDKMCKPNLRAANDIFKDGYMDGHGDKTNKALPVVDFSCVHFFAQEMGTMITSILNPLSIHPSIHTHIYTLGSFPELGVVHQTVPKNYVRCDRAWEVVHG